VRCSADERSCRLGNASSIAEHPQDSLVPAVAVDDLLDLVGMQSVDLLQVGPRLGLGTRQRVA
jgi:hypothetical protein